MPPNWNRTCKCGKYLSVHWPDHPHAWSNGYVYAHRAVVEQHRGRYLPRRAHVHHADGNPRNNSLGNLVVLTARAHGRIHARKPTPFQGRCSSCRRSISRRRAHRTPPLNPYCSRKCYYRRSRKGPWNTGRAFESRPGR